MKINTHIININGKKVELYLLNNKLMQNGLNNDYPECVAEFKSKKEGEAYLNGMLFFQQISSES